MGRKRDGLVPIGKAFSSLGLPGTEFREASPQDGAPGREDLRFKSPSRTNRTHLGNHSGTTPVNWAALAEPAARELWVGEILNLFFFKALTRELQCPAVLRDRANDLIRGT